MPIQPQDTILIISPAGRVHGPHIDNAITILESWGLKVKLGAHSLGQYHNFSGTVEERLADLQWALDHPQAKAIFASRGGYGLIQLLDHINWDGFKKHPKLLIGYSDICNLHPTIQRLGFSSLHALMPNSFPREAEHQTSLSSLQHALFSPNHEIQWVDYKSDEDFEIQGQVVGGNLSILYSLQGTPYAPDYKDKILFLEDLCEYLYHTDRMLHSLALAGVFSQIRGIIVGDFSDMKDNDRPFGKSIVDMFKSISKRFNIPVAFGLKVGHSDPTLALPLGREATLHVQKKRCILRFETLPW